MTIKKIILNDYIIYNMISLFRKIIVDRKVNNKKNNIIN